MLVCVPEAAQVSHVHTETAKLCHVTAPTVVTCYKEKEWFGVLHRGSVSCENGHLSHSTTAAMTLHQGLLTEGGGLLHLWSQ